MSSENGCKAFSKLTEAQALLYDLSRVIKEAAPSVSSVVFGVPPERASSAVLRAAIGFADTYLGSVEIGLDPEDDGLSVEALGRSIARMCEEARVKLAAVKALAEGEGDE